MTEQNGNIPVMPDFAEPAFWKSKKFIAAMIHHALVWGGVVVGGFLDAKSLTVSLPAAILSSTTVTIGQNASQAKVDAAQANSPYSPDRWGKYPPTPTTVVQPSEILPIQTTGGAEFTSPPLPPVVPPRTP